jgi:hypothetical protein
MTPLQAIDRLPLALWMRESAWAFPLIETVHIAAFAAMFGSVLLVELRVFGLQRALPLPALGRLGAVVGISAFAVAACSGSLMFLSDAGGYVANRAFAVKLGLITMAGINMLLFHLRGSLSRPDAIARVQVALSLLLWLGVITAGRMIAYL